MSIQHDSSRAILEIPVVDTYFGPCQTSMIELFPRIAVLVFLQNVYRCLTGFWINLIQVRFRKFWRFIRINYRGITLTQWKDKLNNWRFFSGKKTNINVVFFYCFNDIFQIVLTLFLKVLIVFAYSQSYYWHLWLLLSSLLTDITNIFMK